MAPMPPARRLLRAGLLTLAVWLLVGSVIGVASADDGSSASFVMPHVLMGDRATYDRTVADDEDEMLGRFEVAWAQREPLVLADGQWHELDALKTTFKVEESAEQGATSGNVSIEFGYDAGADIMQVVGVSADGGLQMEADLLLGLLTQQSAVQVGMTVVAYLPYSLPMRDCLFGGVWGGMEIQADGELRMPDLCTPLVGAFGGMTLHGKGIEEVDGVPAIRYSGTLSSLSPQTALLLGEAEGSFRSKLDVWLSPASSMPLRVDSSILYDGIAETDSMVMTGFARGVQPRAVRPAPEAGPIPPLELAPTGPLVPFDDSDSGHGFPLSRAVQASRLDRTVSAFLTEHPDAYVVRAEASERRWAEQPQRSWRFTLADERDALDVFVYQHQPGPASLLPTNARDLAQAHQVIVGEERSSSAPPRSSLPTELPTIGSLFARWEWQRPGRGEPQAWSYDLATESTWFTDMADPEDNMAIAIGRRMETGGVGGVDASGATLAFGLVFDELVFRYDGTPVALTVFEGAGSSLYGADTPLAAAAQSSPPIAAAAATGGWLPTPIQAAGAGAFAVLVGLAYWLWPKAKALAFAGLFSRVAPERLAEHPGRARLLETIRAEPGIHFQELVRRSGLASGTAVHHLNKLARADLIACRPLGRYTCYFPGASPDRQSLLAAPLLRSDGARLVYETILGSPMLSGLELAERTGLQKSTVNYHVQRLTEAGLVAAQRDGRAVRLRATPGAAAAAGLVAAADTPA